MAYYQKGANLKFFNYEDEAVRATRKPKPKPLQPVPLNLSQSISNDNQKESFRKYRQAFTVDDTESG